MYCPWFPFGWFDGPIRPLNMRQHLEQLHAAEEPWSSGPLELSCGHRHKPHVFENCGESIPKQANSQHSPQTLCRRWHWHRCHGKAGHATLPHRRHSFGASSQNEKSLCSQRQGAVQERHTPRRELAIRPGCLTECFLEHLEATLRAQRQRPQQPAVLGDPQT